MLRIFIFNLSGRIILVAISLVSIPIYVKYVGVANYGIIGIYNSIASLAAVFDVAFSNTINRELARRTSLSTDPADTGAVFRSLEIFAWVLAASFAIALAAGARPLVDDWIGAGKYPNEDIVGAIQLMGLLLLLQAPISFYGGCLYGMHKHGLINAINIAGALLSSTFAIATVIFVSPTIKGFFIAQFAGRAALVSGMASAAYFLLVREIGWKTLRASTKVWRRLWRFAIGMNGIGILGLIANQADMVVLSRLLSATALGNYTLARTVSQSLVTLAMPAYQSAFPQLSRTVSAQDSAASAHTFHRFSRFLALIIIPPGVVICGFSEEVLILWTHNPTLAASAWVTLSLLSAGSMLYGLSCMISAVQMANGAVKMMLILGALFVVLLVPALIFMVHIFAQAGAGLAWLIVNLAVVWASAALTLRRYMAGETLNWLTKDILVPMAAVALPVAIARVVFSGPAGSTSALATLVTLAATTPLLCAGVVPEGRAIIVAALDSGVRALKRCGTKYQRQ